MSIIFAAGGALIGFFIWKPLELKSNASKWKGAIVLSIGLMVLLFITSKPVSDEQIIRQAWQQQSIEGLEFESPNELKLTSEFIPDSVAWYYKKLKVFQDDDAGRATLLTHTEITNDSLQLKVCFQQHFKHC